MSTATGASVAGLGAAGLGNLRRIWTDEEANAVLEAAWDAGLRHFDTAPHYGLGLSERRLGAFLATRPREEFTLSTKVGRLVRPTPAHALRDDDEGFLVRTAMRRVWDTSPRGVFCSLEESLDRLGLDRVDVLYLHDPERAGLDQALVEALPALADLRAEGLVERIGVGSMDAGALRAAAESGLVDQVMAAGRHTLASPDRDGVLATCRRHGVAVEVAAVFNGGLLSAAPRAGAVFDYQPVPADVLNRARALADVCARHGVPVRVAALHYPLRHPAVVRVVFGGDTAGQVQENVAALATKIPAGLWMDLEHAGLVPEAATP